MPNSTSDMDGVLRDFLRDHPASIYLDIGAGSGKCATIIRQVNDKAKITGIEISAEYIRQFDLAKLYDGIIEMDAARIPDIGGFYSEIAIIGDMLEHLRHSDGLDLVHFLLYRCQFLLIIVPDRRVQYSPTNPQEEHRSIWMKQDFERFLFQEHHVAGKSFYALRGALADSAAFVDSASLAILAENCIKLGT